MTTAATRSATPGTAAATPNGSPAADPGRSGVLRSNVVVNVDDVGEMRVFYGDVLGLRIVKSWDEPAGAGAIVAIGPSSTIEFIGPPHAERTTPGAARGVEIMVGVADAPAWLDRLRADGVPIVRELIDNPWGDRSFGVDDPEGRRVWIYELLERAPTREE